MTQQTITEQYMQHLINESVEQVLLDEGLFDGIGLSVIRTKQ